jgi:hypothetical protein
MQIPGVCLFLETFTLYVSAEIIPKANLPRVKLIKICIQLFMLNGKKVLLYLAAGMRAKHLFNNLKLSRLLCI